ncbi:MAG: hypothetical protein M3X11_02650 [Acidobacteriota bacterium]|nr:hypothetical protein [Acidobacteriota bacterium]
MSHTITILEGECDLTDTGAPEYDFAEMHRLGKAQGREYQGILSKRAVVLDPDLAAIFADSRAVNDALRGWLAIMEEARRLASRMGTSELTTP